MKGTVQDETCDFALTQKKWKADAPGFWGAPGAWYAQAPVFCEMLHEVISMYHTVSKGRPLDGLDVMSFCDGLVFFAPVSLLVRTTAGVSVGQFFLL